MTAHPETFRASPTLRDAPISALDQLATHAHEVRFEDGERIVPLIDPAPNLGVLLEGLAKLVGVSSEGEERIIYVYHPGDIYGEQLFIQESGIDDYEVLAMGRVRAVVFAVEDFLKVGADHPALLVAVTRALSLRLDQMNDRLMAAMSDDARIRLSRLLLDFADHAGQPSSAFVTLRYPLTHETMGQIIGATRPHTTTVLKTLEEEGAVRRQGQKGLMVRPSRLSEIVSRQAFELLREHEGDDGWTWPRPLGPAK
ncbi:MAG: Crp/Fnr family transcriptional regulator [Gemmatimonadota bacterium]